MRRWAIVLVLFLSVAGALAFFLRRGEGDGTGERAEAPASDAGARAPLDEQEVHELFTLEAIEGGYRYDPVACLLLRPDMIRTWQWPEHPEGRLTLRTNNLGFREDRPTDLKKRGLRILVSGDSHTAGLVENEDSFANLLEARLREQPGRAACEVLNAGVPHTGPYCYLGVLRKYLWLEPDVFIAVLFTGNDFWDELKVRTYLEQRTMPPEGDVQYLARVQGAHRRWPGPVSQGLNQAYRWKHFREEPDRALEAAVATYREIQQLCSDSGIEFLAVVLPTKMDADAGDDADVLEAARLALGLDETDMGINRSLGERFVRGLERAGIRCLDPLPHMRASSTVLYWRRDYHLGLNGHALLARLLEDELRKLP